MRPGSGQPPSNEEVKVGYQPMAALNKPRQLGPSRRMPWRRAVATSCACSAAPSPATSAKPELNTTAARTPRAPSASTVASTCGAGTATMAACGVRGKSATLA